MSGLSNSAALLVLLAVQLSDWSRSYRKGTASTGDISVAMNGLRNLIHEKFSRAVLQPQPFELYGKSVESCTSQHREL